MENDVSFCYVAPNCSRYKGHGNFLLSKKTEDCKICEKLNDIVADPNRIIEICIKPDSDKIDLKSISENIMEKLYYYQYREVCPFLRLYYCLRDFPKIKKLDAASIYEFKQLILIELFDQSGLAEYCMGLFYEKMAEVLSDLSDKDKESLYYLASSSYNYAKSKLVVLPREKEDFIHKYMVVE